MSWTDERVDTLKRLWGEGHSASQIATHLGGVSRNAVIGKVHRLGLESRKKDADAAPAGVEGAAPLAGDAPVSASDDASEAAAAAAAPGDLAVAPLPDETSAEDGTPAHGGGQSDVDGDGQGGGQGAVPEPANDPGAPRETAGAAGEGDEEEAVAPIPLELKLTQLTERTCKWPIGDPMHDDFHFCGHDAEEGRPYCEYHSGLAFQPASERRRVR